MKKEFQFPVVDSKYAAVGGLIAAGVLLLGYIATGELGGHQARIMVGAIFPSIRFLSSGAMAATATIMALMLTLLSLSFDTKTKFKAIHYQRVRQIAIATSAGFVLSVGLLLSLNVPLEKSDAFPSSWYEFFYYGYVAGAAGLGGLLVAIILMLYNAVWDLIQVVGPHDSSHLVKEDESEGAASQERESPEGA